jgi:hypothetical protein
MVMSHTDSQLTMTVCATITLLFPEIVFRSAKPISLEHCFDYIRQNLMCYSDVSVLPISWNPKYKAYTGAFDTPVQKTCRNFEAIYAWAKTRQAEHIPPGNGGIDLHIDKE